MRQLIAGNWKMNGLGHDLAEIETLARAFHARPPDADILVCPPATLIARAAHAAGNTLAIGGQDCHWEKSGAFTGDLSAEMLRDASAVAVILGHSERRQVHRETSAIVAAKALAARRAGLISIICIGETEAERDGGHERDICLNQLTESVPEGAAPGNCAIAYEPIWAIGTGKTPSAAEIEDMHAYIRQVLAKHLGHGARAIRILYGGSVKPQNAKEILALPSVDGALVGGASLKSSEFLAIVAAAPANR